MAYKRISPSPVIEGGTGVTTMTTAYAPVCAGTTATGTLQVASTGLSTAGYILTSNGSSALPSFQGAPISTIIADSGIVGGSTITITGGTSGAFFTGSGTTLTETFNYLSLPTTTSANGLIKLNNNTYFHAFGTDNIYMGKSVSNFTQTGTGQNVGIGAGNTLAATSSGHTNVAIGYNSLSGITTAINAVAIGKNSLSGATTGNPLTNVAIGAFTLTTTNNSLQHTAAGVNAGKVVSIASTASTALGYNSLANNTSGSDNTAVGSTSLVNVVSGTFNAGLGYNSGSNFTTSESSNICINNSGVVSDGNTCRIGASTGSGTQQLNQTFIHGVRGTTTVNNDAVAVLVDSAGQFGTTSSSIRYKENIEDMDNVSSAVLNLRPVTFDFINKPSHKKQIGLIAEEVQKIIPNLVVYNQDGEVESVKYHDISILLLNEIKKTLRRIEFLESKLA